MKQGKIYSEEEQMKLIGIVLREPEIIERYYSSLKGVIVTGISQSQLNGMILDLDSLPNEPFPFKKIFIKWLISVNLTRLNSGEEPITDLRLILKCPIWKVISPPLKRIKMTKEGVFGKPSVKTLNKKQKPGSINKR